MQHPLNIILIVMYLFFVLSKYLQQGMTQIRPMMGATMSGTTPAMAPGMVATGMPAQQPVLTSQQSLHMQPTMMQQAAPAMPSNAAAAGSIQLDPFGAL